MSTPTILAPSRLDELDRLVSRAGTAPSDVRYLGGGTLEVPSWQASGAPRVAVYLPALVELRVRGAHSCGAARTLAQIAADPVLPRLLRETAAACATPVVRTLATLGGNLAACRPGCLAVALLALHATVTIRRPGGALDVLPVAELLRDGPGGPTGVPDVIVGTAWSGEVEAAAVRRVNLQAASGPVLAMVAVAGRRRRGQLRWSVAVGGSGLRPHRLPHAEQLLATVTAPPAELAAAVARELQLPAVAARDGEYQRHLVGVLVGRAVADAMSGGRR